jgi:hypothetical protein
LRGLKGLNIDRANIYALKIVVPTRLTERTVVERFAFVHRETHSFEKADNGKIAVLTDYNIITENRPIRVLGTHQRFDILR